MSLLPLLAQTDTRSISSRFDDFFTGADFAASAAIVVGAVAFYLIVDRVGRRAFLAVGMRGPEEPGSVMTLEREQRLVTLWAAIRRVLIITVVALTALTLLSFWGVPIASFLAVGTVVGVALGFGAQSLVKDVISGFFILSENQFSIGDVVRLGDVAGAVEEIRLRVTVLRDLEGNAHYVPNGSITVASNLTQVYATVVVDVGVAYHEDIDRVMTVLIDEMGEFAADPACAESFLAPPEMLGVNEFADSAVVVRITLRVRPDDRWTTRREFLRRVKVRLDAEGIEIPFAYRTLVLGDRAGWQAVLGSRTD